MMSLTGFPGNPPTRTYNPVIDRITALHGTIGTLAALQERHVSGEGQCVDVCLADTGFSMTEIQCAAFLGEGIVPERTGNGRGLMNTYETRDGWVLVAAISDNIWPRLCEAIDAPSGCTTDASRRLTTAVGHGRPSKNGYGPGSATARCENRWTVSRSLAFRSTP